MSAHFISTTAQVYQAISGKKHVAVTKPVKTTLITNVTSTAWQA